MTVEPNPDPRVVNAEMVDGELTCQCGSTTFRYEENVLTTRAMKSNDENGLTFWSDYDDYGDGDGDPGVVCANCDIGLYDEPDVEFA